MTIDINELRKVIADCYWPTSPVTIKELLDRLEAAERDVALKERVIDALGSELNAVAKERDDAKAAAENIALKLDYLRSKFETAKNAQNDWLRANAPGGWIDNLRIENEALRAKIEAMERQKPAGKFIQHPSNGLWEQDGYGDNPDARPLYALPGAKGEEK